MMKTAFGFVLSGMILISACSTHKKDAGEGNGDEAERMEERVRPAASGGTSAAYFSYTNSLQKADTVLAVNTGFSGMAQIHESYETEEGMMGMRERLGLIVQPGEEIVFEQGGLHVMLMGLNQDLNVGDSVTINIDFAQAGLISKVLPVAQ